MLRHGCRLAGVLTLLMLPVLTTAIEAGQSATPVGQQPPGPVAGQAASPSTPKTLSEAEQRQADELTKRIEALWRAGKFEEAIVPARRVVAVCEKSLGQGHWKSGDARRKVKTLETIASLSPDGRQALAEVPALDEAGEAAYAKARYAEAEALFRRVLEVRRRWLGERHADTAQSYINLAAGLRAGGDLTGAEAMDRKALEINLEVVGGATPTPPSATTTSPSCCESAAIWPEPRKCTARPSLSGRKFWASVTPTRAKATTTSLSCCAIVATCPVPRRWAARALTSSSKSWVSVTPTPP